MIKPNYIYLLVAIVLIINLVNAESNNKKIKIKRDKNVLVLNDDNFDEAIKRYKYLFVEVCKNI
jgi:hypothetical protein